jgi:predicted short-subunit dehydrogenase-like oxidoreductase (DUF2520 family)
MDRSLMNIEIFGAGRAGGAIALAASRAGHRIVGIRTRNPNAAAALEDLVPLVDGTADLRILAVSDNAIESIASNLVDAAPTPTVHLSGARSIRLLDPLAEAGIAVGSFHPLQSFPDAVRGAARLGGAWVAITADEPFAAILDDFAASLGCIPFRLDDAAKPRYHAAASAVANFTAACLGVGARILADVGVPFEATQPLVEAVVANCFDQEPRTALTGPIARGDTETVAAQIAAVRDMDDDTAEAFVDLARATARFAGSSAEMREVIG